MLQCTIGRVQAGLGMPVQGQALQPEGRNMTKALLFSLAALGLAASATATAAPAETITVKVSYSDLDIASEAGLGKLHKRVRTAIRRACAAESSATLGLQTNSACEKQAYQLATREIERHRQRNFALLTQPKG
jgi:UrcA family protein